MDNNMKKQTESYWQYHEKIRKENEEMEKREKYFHKKAKRIRKIKTFWTIVILFGGFILFGMVLPTEEPDIHGNLDNYSWFECLGRVFVGQIIIIVLIFVMHYMWITDKRHDAFAMELEKYHEEHKDEQ